MIASEASSNCPSFSKLAIIPYPFYYHLNEVILGSTGEMEWIIIPESDAS